MKKNKNYLIMAFVLMLTLTFAGFASATCTYTYNNTDADDFFNVSTNTDKTITMTETQLFEQFVYFTPRTNFTIRLTESITGKMTGENTTIATTNWVNFSSNLDIYNSTDLIDPSNYTLINTSAKTWVIQWKVSNYNGTTLSAIFNRTFVACRLNMSAPTECDDLVLAPAGVRTSYTTSHFISQNTPSDYGDYKTFRFNSSTPLAIYMNSTNWAVGWSYTEVDCGSTCEKTINTTLLDIILTVFIVGMLVFVAYSIYQGGLNTKTVVALVVGFIVMLVAMVIIKGILAGVCVV